MIYWAGLTLMKFLLFYFRLRRWPSLLSSIRDWNWLKHLKNENRDVWKFLWNFERLFGNLWENSLKFDWIFRMCEFVNKLFRFRFLKIHKFPVRIFKIQTQKSIIFEIGFKGHFHPKSGSNDHPRTTNAPKKKIWLICNRICLKRICYWKSLKNLVQIR